MTPSSKTLKMSFWESSGIIQKNVVRPEYKRGILILCVTSAPTGLNTQEILEFQSHSGLRYGGHALLNDHGPRREPCGNHTLLSYHGMK